MYLVCDDIRWTENVTIIIAFPHSHAREVINAFVYGVTGRLFSVLLCVGVCCDLLSASTSLIIGIVLLCSNSELAVSLQDIQSDIEVR